MPMAANTHRDENWVRGIFLLVPQKEKEDPTYSIDVLMVQPCGMKSAPFPFHVDKKHHRNIFDVFIVHGYAWKFHLSQFGGTSIRVLRYYTKTNITHGESTRISFRSMMFNVMDFHDHFLTSCFTFSGSDLLATSYFLLANSFICGYSHLQFYG